MNLETLTILAHLASPFPPACEPPERLHRLFSEETGYEYVCLITPPANPLRPNNGDVGPFIAPVDPDVPNKGKPCGGNCGVGKGNGGGNGTGSEGGSGGNGGGSGNDKGNKGKNK